MNPIYRGQYPPKNTDVLWIKGKKIFLFGTKGWEEVTENTIVDQELDPNSHHSISNSAVAAALNQGPNPVDLSGINLYTNYPADSDEGKLMYNAMGKDIKCSLWEKPLKSMGIDVLANNNLSVIRSHLNDFAEEHDLSVNGYYWFWGLSDDVFVDKDGVLNYYTGVGLAETHIEGESGIYYALIAI